MINGRLLPSQWSIQFLYLLYTSLLIDGLAPALRRAEAVLNSFALQAMVSAVSHVCRSM